MAKNRWIFTKIWVALVSIPVLIQATLARYSRPVVYAYVPNFFWIESIYCVTFQRRKPQFRANFDIWRASVPIPFTDEGQIYCARVDRRSTLTCQISSRSVYSVALGWRETPNFWTSAFCSVASWRTWRCSNSIASISCRFVVDLYRAVQIVQQIELEN